MWIKPRPGEHIDSLLRRFKKVVENSGILSDFRKNERYEKPSIKRKRKQAAARKRAFKEKKKLERFEKFQKPTGPNWKWNKNHTKKIPLRTYTNNFSRPKKSNGSKRFVNKGNSNE